MATILAAARELLSTRGYAALSLRNVAAHAGIRLGNLQYYFPSKNALIHALLGDIAAPYAASLPAVRRRAGSTPREQLLAWIEYLIADALAAPTQRLFIQTWAMADATGRAADEFLAELYADDIAQIRSLLSAARPDLPQVTRRARAHVLAAAIEGMMVTARTLSPRARKSLRVELLALAGHYASDA